MRIQSMPIFIGILCGLSANLIWGLAFLIPVLLPSSDSVALALGRYLVFGVLSACILIAQGRKGIRGISWRIWITALLFAFAGHLGYYFFLVQAITHAGTTIATAIICTLPVTIALTGNWIRKEFSFPRLFVPLSFIIIGLTLVNIIEAGAANNIKGNHLDLDLLIGTVSALIALTLWTSYAVANASFLRRHPDISSSTWSTLMGVSSHIMSLLALPIAIGSGAIHINGADNLLPLIFAALVIGIIVSWVGTLLWNRASGLLPISIAGQIAVVQTIAGMVYGFAWFHHMPPPRAIRDYFAYWWRNISY
ncbi:DMT family transporter [Commensalibacter nepenthis]|uniref:DMT family transporter n=1 Tax=Commensalibacter nepenthis TaxID=3043872 RepID=A0ABT6Q8N3_9PROT|nr:DMT family transporter [Commensalibacter sp. TBRC 10068]MDI2113263.1 DMT family transporter [Commensalibacter sp. TBRC 10068]